MESVPSTVIWGFNSRLMPLCPVRLPSSQALTKRVSWRILTKHLFEFDASFMSCLYLSITSCVIRSHQVDEVGSFPSVSLPHIHEDRLLHSC